MFSLDLKELKQKSTEKFQETDNFNEDYQELKQYFLKNCWNYNEKKELMTTIASLRLENQILEKELYNKHIIINNLTRNETRFRLRVAATIL